MRGGANGVAGIVPLVVVTSAQPQKGRGRCSRSLVGLQRKEAQPLSHALTSDSFNIWTPRQEVALNWLFPYPLIILVGLTRLAAPRGGVRGAAGERGAKDGRRVGHVARWLAVAAQQHRRGGGVWGGSIG